MKNMIRVGAIAAAAALVLTACAAAPDEEPAAPETNETADGGEAPEAPVEDVDFKACMVSDFGGFDDNSFNDGAYSGLVRASEELGIEMAEAESTSEADYGPNLQAQLAAGCDLIITVGYALSSATVEAALANPEVNFAIVDDLADNDFDGEVDAPNIKPITFETDEAAFLAGYAAASVSESGTLGTFGGEPYPTVTIFMDGFLAGANHYNEVKGADVSVLGWDGSEGSFVNSFDDIASGQNQAQGFLDQGADVIMPVAGPVGNGAASAIQSAGDAWMIGVDQDWAITTPNQADIMLTSVLKQISNAVFDTVETSLTGFSSEAYVGTLENEGVGLAPFAEGTVSDETLAELDELRAAIIAGDIAAGTAG